MNCREAEELLTMRRASERGIRPLRDHLEECVNCRELARIVELPVAEMQIDSSRIGRLQKVITRDLRPVRQLAPSWVFLFAFALIFCGLTYLGLSYLQPAGWFVLMPMQKITMFATLAASASLLAFSLVKQMIPGQKAWFRPELLPVALFVLLCLVISGVFQARADSTFLRTGAACFRAGVPYAFPAAFVFWLILRRGAILKPRAVGGIAGMLAGLVSTTVLEMHCDDLNLWHILVWHAGIALLGLVAGVLAAAAGEAIRSRQS